MRYGYARVSTNGQARKGTSLEEQTKELTEAGAEKIVCDAYTGKTMNRPELSKLLEQLTEGDTLIVTKLDRFCRTMVEGVDMIVKLMEKGVTVNILNMGIVQNSPTGKLTLQMLAAIAEFERNMIIERTQSGRQARRAEAEEKGEVFMDFRPRKMDDKQIKHAMELLDSGKSYKDVSELLKVSKSTLIRRRREQKANKYNE